MPAAEIDTGKSMAFHPASKRVEWLLGEDWRRPMAHGGDQGQMRNWAKSLPNVVRTNLNVLQKGLLMITVSPSKVGFHRRTNLLCTSLQKLSLQSPLWNPDP